MTDRDVVDQLAGGRRIVALDHARQRTTGAVGVLWRNDTAIAISAHRCELATLPGSIGALGQLERLDVGDNRLAELPDLPPDLRELYIYDNQLERLPALPPLAVLDANRNRLAELPELVGIEFVYAAANRLTTLPSISGVSYLNAGDNPLASFALGDQALVEVRLDGARLPELAIGELGAACALGPLANLRELSLRNTALRAVPAAIRSLAKLRALDLRGCELDDVPEALLELPLAKLDLRWNPLRRRPGWLGDLERRGCLVYV